MSDPNLPKVGDVVVYTDELSVEHDALVTAYHGPSDKPNMAINCVFVSNDPEKRDPYGNQLERRSSIGRQSEYTAAGNFWKPKS